MGTDLFPTATYEVWAYSSSRVCVTLNLAPMSELLAAAFGDKYLGSNGTMYVIEEHPARYSLSAIHVLLHLYRQCWRGKMVLSERALDLIQEVVGEQGSLLLPFTDLVYTRKIITF